MEQNKTGLFASFYYSIAGFSNYRYLLRRSIGGTVVYVLLLALIIGIVSYIPVVNVYNQMVEEFTANFDTWVPDFTFSDGHLKVSGKMPIIISKVSPAIIIDTTEGADESILDDYDSAILILSDRMIQKDYVNRKTTPFSPLVGMQFSRDTLRQALPVMKAAAVFVYLFGAIFFMLGKLLTALIVSFFGLVANSAMKTNLSYHNIFKISAYAMTLPLLVCTALTFLPVMVPMLWLLFYALSAVYVFGSVRAIRIGMDQISIDPPQGGDQDQ